MQLRKRNNAGDAGFFAFRTFEIVYAASTNSTLSPLSIDIS